MTEETTPAKTGDAAWKEQRDAISKRNAEAHKRAQSEKKSRTSYAQEAIRADAMRESEQLRDLNKRLDKQQSRKAR
jgi:hypothetical protein